jgi:hypothetical protein
MNYLLFSAALIYGGGFFSFLIFHFALGNPANFSWSRILKNAALWPRTVLGLLFGR